jgi:protein-disulfide isomerase
MRELESSLLQRKLHLFWSGFEGVIDDRLVTAEAERRGITVAELRSKEIETKSEPPSEEEVKAFYDDNASQIEVPFDIAAPHIKRQLAEQNMRQREAEFLQDLRTGATIDYKLPVPPLPRETIAAEGAPAIGPNDAKVTIVEFSDFQCPYCGRAAKQMQALRQAYPDKLQVIFRDFPLAQHPQARVAAEAAQCAYEQGKFWEYHDVLFANQQALSSTDLKAYATQIGLDGKAFEACLGSGRPSEAVGRHQEAGERYGVDGTPAIYLNGIKLIGLLPLPLMRVLIDAELFAANSTDSGHASK